MSIDPSTSDMKIESLSTKMEEYDEFQAYSRKLRPRNFVGKVVPRHANKKLSSSVGVKEENDSEEEPFPETMEVKSGPIKRKVGRPRKNSIASKVNEAPIKLEPEEQREGLIANKVKVSSIKRKRGRQGKLSFENGATFHSISVKIDPTISDDEKHSNKRRRTSKFTSKKTSTPSASGVNIKNGPSTSKGKNIFEQYRFITSKKRILNILSISAQVEEPSDLADSQVEGPKEESITVFEFYTGNTKEPKPIVQPVFVPKDQYEASILMTITVPEALNEELEEPEVLNEELEEPYDGFFDESTITASETDVQAIPNDTQPKKKICKFFWYICSSFFNNEN